jgi:predicted SAM-dependent methyltransferase
MSTKPSTRRQAPLAPPIPAAVAKALRDRGGIILDIGAGEHCHPGAVGMDIRPLPGIDIVWDLEKLPYPLPDECCISIIASHVVEHISPARFNFIKVMDEWWRIMKPKGRLMIACPYGVNSRFQQDPTHCHPVNEVQMFYFAPEHPSGLWNIYKPKPWRIIANAWHSSGDLEVVLEKLSLDEIEAPQPKQSNGHAGKRRL